MKKIIKRILTITAYCTVLSSSLAIPTSLQANTLDSHLAPDRAVLSMIKDKSSHALYIAGYFNGLYEKTGGGAIFDRTGALIAGDTTFSGKAVTSAADGNGGFYIGGDFTTAGPVSEHYLAHINPNGTVDTTFQSHLLHQVTHLALANDKLYVATEDISDPGNKKYNVYQVNPDTGTINPAFVVKPNKAIYTMRATPQALYVGGIFRSINNVSIQKLAKLNLDTGAVDTSFYKTIDTIKNIITSNDGKLFLSGYMRNIIKIDESTGVVDPQFHLKFTTFPGAIATDGGWLYASFRQAPYLRRYNTTTGEQDANFTVASLHTITTMNFNDRYMYLTGSFNSVVPGRTVQKIARFDKNSLQRDQSYSASTNGSIITSALTNDHLFVGGWFESAGLNKAQAHLAKIDLSTGHVDSTFHPSVNGNIMSMTLHDHDLYIGGTFTKVNGHGIKNLAKLSKETALVDTSFHPNPNSAVYLLKAHDSHLYVGGKFKKISGTWWGTPYLARYSLKDLSYDKDYKLYLNNEVWDAAFSNDSIYVGGRFTGKLRKFDLVSGDRDLNFNPEINNTVKALLIDGEHVYATGYFLQRAVELNRFTGANTKRFDMPLLPSLFSVAKHGDFIYIGGNKVLLRINTLDGSKDPSFTPNPDGIVYSLLVDDSTLFESGYYRHISGNLQPYVSTINLN